jgi:hypothetical protein
VRWLKDVKNGAAFARNWSETGYYKQFYHKHSILMGKNP